jgi:hypothetical protein
MRRSMVVSAVVAASLLPAAAAVADGPPSSVSPLRPVGPGQFFSGLVDGVPGSGAIRLACPAVTRPGQTGHPVAGQSISLRQQFPPSAAPSALGFTGGASTIAASLRIVSPSAATAAAPIALAVFSFYGVQASIPTTLSLPCGGAGAVVFAPVQGGTAARSYTEPVKFPFISPVG